MGARHEASVGARRSKRHRLETALERALVAEVLSGDEMAAEVFCQRYYGALLAASARYGVSGGDADHLVLDVLHDFILALADRRTQPPAAVLPHLLLALRRRAFASRRSRGRATTAFEITVTARDEAVVSGSCSESSLRQSNNAAELEGPPPALSHLARALIESLDHDDKLLLEWVGHHVPQRLMAKWLGEEYETVGRRVRRLVSRLARLSIALAAALDGADQAALRKFFTRAGALPPAHNSERSRPYDVA